MKLTVQQEQVFNPVTLTITFINVIEFTDFIAMMKHIGHDHAYKAAINIVKALDSI